jgi:hypothetical protein
MRKRLLQFLLLSCITSPLFAQNFSGLKNKKLIANDDVGSLVESGLGSLFGNKLSGKIDSVIVLWDSEKTLKVKIYYKDYVNGFFTVSTMNAAKQKQNEIIASKFMQSASASPVECTVQLSDAVSKGTLIESPFLRIDVAKKENGLGKVSVFSLNKNWKNELDPQNVVIRAVLSPVGDAASLSKTAAVDVVPVKKINFDPKAIYYAPQKPAVKTLMLKPGGGNAFKQIYHYSVFDDISGTWINNDAATTGLTKIIITNNNTIHVYNKCPTTDCDWGTVALTDIGGNKFTAEFPGAKMSTALSLSYAGGTLTVTQSTKSRMLILTKPTTYTFRKELPIYLMANIYTLKQLPPANTTGPADDGVAKGPDKNMLFLLNGLSSNVDFERPQDICNINMNVFRDKSELSGVWYILPADYHLKWETQTKPEKGYNFHILYGASRAGETASPDAPVRMSATLTAGISVHERNFVEALLKTLPHFRELRFLPLKEKPQFTFQNTLSSQYNIPADKIAVETSTDLSNDIKVSWQTDADTKEFIQAALTARDGISASVILKPVNDEIIEQQIPAIINLADIRTLGKISLEPSNWRTTNWRNTTPYPLRLNYLHVLKKADRRYNSYYLFMVNE